MPSLMINMNVGIIILILIVIFFVFVYKELSTCKSIVSKINEDIEITKNDMKHRIKCEMNDCLVRVEKINYDNMQQLKRINQFNNSPITKKYTYLADAAAAAAVGTACPSFEDYDMHGDIFRRRSTLGESDIYMSGPSNGAERETQNYIYDQSRGNGLDEFPNYDPSAAGTFLNPKAAISDFEKVNDINLKQEQEQEPQQQLSQQNKSLSSNANSRSNISNKSNKLTNVQTEEKILVSSVGLLPESTNVISDTSSRIKKLNQTNSSSSSESNSLGSNSLSSNSSKSNSLKSNSLKSNSSKSNSLKSNSSKSKSIKIETKPLQESARTNNKSKLVLRPITHYEVKELREIIGRCGLPQTKNINGKRKLLSKAELHASLRKYLESK